MPPPLLLNIIKDSFKSDGIKKVHIYAPNVSASMDHAKKKNKKFETSTRYQRPSKKTETESSHFGKTESTDIGKEHDESEITDVSKEDDESESTDLGQEHNESESTYQEEDESESKTQLQNDETQTETAMFTFMDKYGNKIASFFHDM